MARTISEATKRAISILDSKKYRYVYGGKGQPYTSALVKSLARQLPSMYTATYLKKTLSEADRGFIAIDCSGFVCDVLGVPMMGSAQLRSSAEKVMSVDKSNAKEGMALWRQGHIAYVGKRNGKLKVMEAQGVDQDMREYDYDDRAKHFTNLIIVKGTGKNFTSSNSKPVSTPAKKKNPYTKPTRTIYYDAKNRKVVCSGDDVKWVQYELVEAGYKIGVDGKFGPASHEALLSFQKSCKITVDGKCGPTTRKYLETK